jgi:starch-binding outer membrane protein, SusD/RagB family
MRIFTIISAISIASLSSCEEFVNIDTPKSQIVRTKVFEDDAGARAAVAGIFSQIMSGSSFASGSSFSVTVIAGLSSDEFLNHSTSQPYVTLYNNTLTSINNTAVTQNWNDVYLVVYGANSILEGCLASKTLSKAVKDQVIGEAKFIRAFSYFYLVNLFGDVPKITGTDYRVNKSASRAPTSEVYQLIESDLIDAKQLLLADYSMSNSEKVEPNKWAATALLARAYLYQKKWAEAEAQATEIISSNVFSLPASLTSVFTKNSSEAIWQLMPVLPGVNTNEASLMIITGNPTRWSLSPSATGIFAPADKRLSSWIGSITTGGKTHMYPAKYKVRLTGQPITEYYMVLRLAEQFLIRAEARAMQNKLVEAIADLNVIRARAGVANIDATGMSQGDVLAAINVERQSEFFAEWGHRWFDLKRSGNIDAVLGPVKTDWQSKDALFPIPQAEINANPNLTQNN